MTTVERSMPEIFEVIIFMILVIVSLIALIITSHTVICLIMFTALCAANSSESPY